MPLCVKELHHRDLQFPVMIGGAAINRPYAHRTLFVDDETPYEPGVFYAKDAFEGLSLMDRIIDPDAARPSWSTQTVEAARPGARQAGAANRSAPRPKQPTPTAIDGARGRSAHAAVLGRAARSTDSPWPMSGRTST